MMKQLHHVFDEIKTPESWKENLYEAAYVQKKQPSRHIIKKFAAGISIAAAAALGTLTVGAVTGTFNIVEILRSGFSDEISAEKMYAGDYQPLDVVCESEYVSFRAAAFLGDTSETYTVVEARLKDGITADHLSIDVNVLEESITNLSQYTVFTLHSVPDTTEDGETVFYFNVRNLPSAFPFDVPDTDLVLRIYGIHLTDGEREIEEDTEISMRYRPDLEVLSQIEQIAFREPVNINEIPCVIQDMLVSDYQIMLNLNYLIPESITLNGVTYTDNWEIGDLCARKLLNLKSENSYMPIAEECPIRLIVDGVPVPFGDFNENATHAPYEIMLDPYEPDDLDKFVSRFYCILNFKPTDFEAAQSVAVEIRTDSGETKVLKIK